MTEEKKIFIAVLITSFMGPFMGSSFNIAIPTLATEFGVPAQDLSWVVTAYLLGSVALLVPFGRLADILGRRKLYVIGSFIVGLMDSSSEEDPLIAESGSVGDNPVIAIARVPNGRWTIEIAPAGGWISTRRLVLEGAAAVILAALLAGLMRAADAGSYEKAEALVAEGNDLILEAHNTQTKLLQLEASGEHVTVNFLTVHARKRR